VAGRCFSHTALPPTLDEGPLPGSFDPLTLGHLDLIERADRPLRCLVVAVVAQPGQASQLPA